MKCPVFIVSHNRPSVPTYKMLRSSGYTGKIYIVLDNLDTSIKEYDFEDILVFNKEEWYNKTKTFYKQKIMSTPVYARNFVFNKAKELGLNYYICADDDLTGVIIRYPMGDSLKSRRIDNLDKIFNFMVEYLESTPLLSTLSFSGPRCYIGGLYGAYKNKLTPNYYQLTVHKTNSSTEFIGEYNEDMNYVIDNLLVGRLNYSLVDLQVVSPERSSNSGGIAYQEDWFKILQSTVLLNPSGIGWKESYGKVVLKITKNNVYPKILSDRCRKRVEKLII